MTKICNKLALSASLLLLAPLTVGLITPAPAVASSDPPPAVGTDHDGNEYVFWENANQGLETVKYTEAKHTWGNPQAVTVDGHGMGPLGSAPTVAVDYDTGYQYVFWKGTAPNSELFEAYFNANGWHGPTEVKNGNDEMGPLNSAPTAGIDTNGVEYVFWKSTTGTLWWTHWDPANGWVDPHTVTDGSGHDMGTLGSGPAAGIGYGGINPTQFVAWEGTGATPQLWYANARGLFTVPEEQWAGPNEALSSQTGGGLGPLGSQPTACTLPGSQTNPTTYVAWKSTVSDLEVSSSSGEVDWSAPTAENMGPLNSPPALSCGTSVRAFWKGTNGNLWEAYSTDGTNWTGPIDQGIGLN
jgi:hypothetical protein